MRFLTFIVLAIPFFAFAQEQEDSDTLRIYKLEEIVVTAARGGSDALQVPMAIGIVEAKEFSWSRRIGLNDALSAVPGVFAQSRSGGQDVRLTLRGFIGVSNLTDVKYAASAFINPAGQIAPAYLEPGLPRNFYGGLDLQFRL